MDVTIVEQPELRVAGIRHIGPYQQIGQEFGSLGGILKGPPPPGLADDCPLSRRSGRRRRRIELRSDAGIDAAGQRAGA